MYYLSGSCPKSYEVSSPAGTFAQSDTLGSTRHPRGEEEAQASSNEHRITFGAHECCTYIMLHEYNIWLKINMHFVNRRQRMLHRRNCGGEYRLSRIADDPSASRIW